MGYNGCSNVWMEVGVESLDWRLFEGFECLNNLPSMARRPLSSSASRLRPNLYTFTKSKYERDESAFKNHDSRRCVVCCHRLSYCTLRQTRWTRNSHRPDPTVIPASRILIYLQICVQFLENNLMGTKSPAAGSSFSPFSRASFSKGPVYLL